MKSFITSPISFSTQQEMDAFILHIERLRVHPTNFIGSDGRSLQEADMGEPLDGNRVYGSPITYAIKPENLTLSLSAQGGLDVAIVQESHGYLTMTNVVGDLLNDMFTQEFHKKNKGFEITLMETDEQGNTNITEIIELDYYYSPAGRLERSKKRAEEISNKLNSVRTEVQGLIQQSKKLEVELKHELQEIQELQKGTVEEETLPF